MILCFFNKRVEIVDMLALGKFERVMMDADVAEPEFPLLAARVGLADPHHGVAVVPADDAVELPFALEAEKAQHGVVKFLRAIEIADMQDDMFDADDFWHAANSLMD